MLNTQFAGFLWFGEEISCAGERVVVPPGLEWKDAPFLS